MRIVMLSVLCLAQLGLVFINKRRFENYGISDSWMLYIPLFGVIGVPIFDADDTTQYTGFFPIFGIPFTLAVLFVPALPLSHIMVLTIGCAASCLFLVCAHLYAFKNRQLTESKVAYHVLNLFPAILYTVVWWVIL